jgi:pimeloyl-ACP methyl ester carboxylesterase
VIITQDTVWDGSQTYIFNEGEELGIDSDVTLTVKEGTIIKMGRNSAILVLGKMDLQGTTEKPVVITSIKDDAWGGDSNGDGTSTVPTTGDWMGIIVHSTSTSSPKSEFKADYAVIKYGGGYEDLSVDYFQAVSAAKIQISHSDLLDNDMRFYIIQSDQTSVNYSNIYNPTQPLEDLPVDNMSYGIWAHENNTGIIDATNNYWGSVDGPTRQEDARTGNIKGSCLFPDTATYLPFATSPIPLFEFKPKIKPVILIPGILGSWQIKGQWTIDPILHTYDNLLEALRLAGYKDGETLFTLPYQWRQSNVETAHELKAKIAEVKTICNCDKVDLIGHSMGGLVARQYIESSEYVNDVDKMIFLATPHRGATKAYLMWEGGKVGLGTFNQFMERLFWFEAKYNGFNSVSQYLRDKPIESVRELLPIYNFLLNKGSDTLRSYPNNYPVNPFLENLNNAGLLYKLNTVKIYNFLGNVGEGSTITNLRVVSSTNSNGDWVDGYPENYDSASGDHGLEYGSGDGTVPSQSNTAFAGQLDITINSDHNRIATDAQKAVIKDLTGQEPITEVRNSIISKILMIRIFSPADFIITAPDGKKLGRDEGNQDINEINSAFYFNEGEMEFAVIPNPKEGEYKVDLLGTDNGSYKLSMSYLSENNISVDKEFTGNITTEENQEFKINYVSSSDPLSELLPQDNVSPIVSIISPTSSNQYFRIIPSASLKPSFLNPNSFVSNLLTINYAVTDDFSGISTTTLTLNRQKLSSTTLDLFNYPVGKYESKVTATDKANNVSSSTINFEIVTDLKHSMADIDIMKQNKLITALVGSSIQTSLKSLQEKIKAKDVAITWFSNNNKLKIQLLAQRKSMINNHIDNLNKYLKNLLSQKKINRKIYDIIKSNNDYLKNNL